ncbi:MAG TPA: GNAT family N-acetyltransferase [Gemmatimonadaceae bacterium]|nr:GNAT family N-acetyltransferase [Gemmatimonadaceae bacterium]
MSELQRVHRIPTDALASLLAASIEEGFHFVERLVREWEEAQQRFNQPGELLLAVYKEEDIIAIGGLTSDPYSDDPALGRLRHIYVRPDARRRGIGRRLVRILEQAAEQTYRALVLRTDSPAAARFYETLGYTQLPPGSTATHRRELVAPRR